ncbi:ankyrin repeat domain-containing protein [Chryseobacterium phosphatilyticum]|uniref:Ankyrin repeat domain-containing protein n=1 Tax=Chryseobacterium phosphatilyticum TaxID=475075 RepID=A0A316X8P6_9FLAO|nr:ankyrin repeat domain-containing protein [Chryseobacterium phosphatilyticum]PWN69924.1 ankyrin repeat domain-containing protein [Chryseobacterium phosphatilyticum]
MKKITSTIFLFGILAFANMLSAQKMTQEKMKAIYSDDISIFKKHFAPADYNKCFTLGYEQFSPLGFSVLSGKTKIINFLLSNKANINKKCTATPLQIANDAKRVEIAQLLTERGATNN